MRVAAVAGPTGAMIVSSAEKSKYGVDSPNMAETDQPKVSPAPSELASPSVEGEQVTRLMVTGKW